MRHARYFATKLHQGFTLVELMIAIAISAILLLGVVQVFVLSRHAYKLDNGLSQAQENARYAVHVMSEDIRMAGYVGCRAVNVADILKSNTNWMYNFNTPLQGWDGAATGTYPYPTEFAANVVKGTDAIVVLRGDNTQYRITQMPASNNASFILNTTQGLAQNDIVVISDCNQASVFQITKPIQNNTITHAIGSVSSGPGNCTNLLGSPAPSLSNCTGQSGTAYPYGTTAGVLKLKATAYYIGKSLSGSGNALWSMSLGTGGVLGNPQELAEGIENMQILYGVDTNNDKLADQYITADKVTSSNNWNNVVSVRLGLLVDSPDHVLKATNNNTYTIADNSTISPGTGGPAANQHPKDYKMRFAITTTIKLRNRGIM